MNFAYQAVFVDLDGTLLNSHKVISQKNLAVLDRLIEEGVRVVIATGRTIKSVKTLTKNLRLNAPVITLNGSEIWQSPEGHAMSTVYLENTQRDGIYRFCKNVLHSSVGLPYSFANILVDTGKNFYCLDPEQADVQELFDHYDLGVESLDLNQPPCEQVVGFLFLLTPDSDRDAFFKDELQAIPPGVSLCTFNGWPWIEASSKKANKGTAMEFVCDYLGIPLEKTIAFGDGPNDIEMLKKAGLGVSVANADPLVQHVVKARAPSNDEDGVAVFLERLMGVSHAP